MNTVYPAKARNDFQRLAAEQIARAAAATFEATASPDAKRRPAGPGPRRDLRGAGVPSGKVMLIEDGRGVLRWDYRPGVTTGGSPSLRRATFGGRYRGLFSIGETLVSTDVAEVGPNEITAALQKLDQKLTPQQGLRMITGGKLSEPLDPAGGHRPLTAATRLLLFVHGTFSKGDVYVESLPKTFFADAMAQRYSHVASFDHPTLSVSPVLNAIDLENALRLAGLPDAASVDVVCHSRGGLVAAWWIRSTRYRVEKLVAAGAPLKGTSLASPYRIRHLLDYFANYARMLSGGFKASAAFPTFASGFLAGAGGLVGILGGISGALSSLPVADAAIALVPGLNGQSRVTNNAELSRLWADSRWTSAAGNPACYVLSSDYQPERKDPWRDILAQLKQLPWIAANGVADKLFPEGGNDLVVDTPSMSHVSIAPTDTLSFGLRNGENDGVHHCAYFTHRETVDRLYQWLQLP
ncbi:esterase/lipase family protein [Variovorax atrisoli]|uniref:esterase/lipase family protein n=1 Tax=Variovorax atrisoli TaxID=3394203 RepID=UPI00162291E2|nr:hypothetical protein [Variovorax sp. BK613]MBB3639303.1 pimeloyl-ACP methyl ester carboxylesterase [Variovorax sp. BK613]